MTLNSISPNRRRDGYCARVQRAVTGWIFNAFHLRRASDANRRRAITRTLNLLFALFALSRSGWGSSGTEGASFLNIPVGGRPAALGSGYTALATDAYAPTWNPAGLGFVDSNQLAGQHLSYLESIHYEYLSFVHPLAKPVLPLGPARAALGAAIQYLGSGDIMGRNINGDPTGNFDSHYVAYAVAYGQTITDKLSLGVTGKWINAKIADVGANAFAFDAGTFYRMSRRLNLAATVTNVGSTLTFLRQHDSLPLAFHLAAAYQLVPQLNVNTEFVYRKSGLPSWHGGVEWSPIPAVAIRAGYRTDTTKGLSPMAGLTTGIGLKVHGQEFSYAWLPYGDLGSTQYFSLVLRFGARPESKRDLIHYQSIERPQTVNAGSDSRINEANEVGELMAQQPAPRMTTADPMMLQELLDAPQKQPVAKNWKGQL